MTEMGSDKAFGQCRCCLKNGYHKDITKPYFRNGVREVYRKLFLDCFNLFLSTSTKLTDLICTSCIRRLEDALEFKAMVVESEQQLLSEIGSNNTLFVNVPEEAVHSEVDIKLEQEEVKEEPQDCSADYEDAVDNNETYGTIDKEALHKLPNEELVEGEAELLSRFSNQLRPLPTREALYTIYPSFTRHLDMLKGKVILPKMIEKLLDMGSNTATTGQIKKSQIHFGTEKSALVANSATLLENSNLTPFKSKNRAGYPCFYCRHSFETLDKIRDHQVRVHKKSELRKLLKVSGPESLVVYVDTTDLKCTICNQNIANVNDLKEHLTKTHKKVFIPGFTDRIIPFRLTDNNIFVCQICGFSLETFGSIERHMNTHYRNYICIECGTGFVTKYRLKVHIKSMHIDGVFPCEQCKKVFASQQKMKNHVATVHKLIKRFKCPKCSERFSEYFKRQKHMVEKHGVAPLQYKCNVCDKSFDRRYTLSRHMKRDHLEERDFQCEMCSYNCFTNNELRVHMIKHNGERIYECGVCKKAYARKKTLREHMRIHNNDRRFACAVCGQAFVQKCSLKGHMKTHHVEYNTI